MKKEERIFPKIFGTLAALTVLATWFYALFYVTTDQHQGEVYRIIYLHVPSAFTSFLSSFILFIFSVIGLRKQQESNLRWAKSAAEIGLAFTVLTLATGSIWGKPTWGTWWTWDARLTTTFILALLYCGYLLLWNSLQAGPMRVKICSILGIINFAMVPIIYQSVNWWRTLHQPQSILRRGGATMSPEILYLLLTAIFAMLSFSIWMMYTRATNLKLKEDLEEASYKQLRS